MATSPTPTATSRVRSPSASLASSFSFIAHSPAMHADDPRGLSSDESFASLSDESSEDDEIVWSVSDLSASIISSQPGLLSPELFSDDDFIVLGQAQTSTRAVSARASGAPSVASDDALSDVLRNLTVEDLYSDEEDSVRVFTQPSTPSRRRKRRTARAVATPSLELKSPAQNPPPTTPRRKKSKAKVAAPAVTPDSKKATKKKAAKKAAKKAQASAVPSAVKRGPGFGARPIVDDVSEVGDVKAMSLYDDAVQYVSS